MAMLAAGWGSRGRFTAAAAGLQPWRKAPPALARPCATSLASAAYERAVVESNHRGHLSVITSDSVGKTRVVSERARWLMGNSEPGDTVDHRRVLVLTGSGVESGVRAQLAETEAFYALERQGHGIYSVREFCRLMLEETGQDQARSNARRVLGRHKLAAFLLHHRKELPFGRLHKGDATAPLQQNRHVRDLLQLFQLLEAHGVTPATYLSDALERQDDALSIELARTYGVYHELLAKHGVTTWDGVVTELLALCSGDDAFVDSLLRGYTDIVVDDVQSLTPAMVQLVAKLCGHASIESITSVSRVLDPSQPCPRTQQLEEILSSSTGTETRQQVLLTAELVDGRRSDLQALSQLLWRPDMSRKRRATGTESVLPASDALQCVVFTTVTEEELGIGRLLHDKVQSGAVTLKEVAIMAPTIPDARRIALSLRAQGFPVQVANGPGALPVQSATDSGVANLFDEPIASAVFSLLVSLSNPSDSRHLYNVLRSDLFAFPAELLSRLMEKERRSHVDLFTVLEAFVASKGSSLYPEEDSSSDNRELTEREAKTHTVEAGLATATAFVKLMKSLRAVCHSRSTQEIVHMFLEETGRMESLLDPGSTEEEHEAIVLAEFLRELEGVQRIVQSVHVPLVVPYLMELRDSNRSRGSTQSPTPVKAEASNHEGEVLHDEAIRVLPLTLASLEALASSNTVSLLVLMSMRDSKFPGRMRRVTLPLPYSLLSTPFPIQTRDEHIERCEQLAAFAMTIPRDQVVLSFASVVTSGPSTGSHSGTPASKLKTEQISRVFHSVWQDPPVSKLSDDNKHSDDDDARAAPLSVVPASAPTVKYNPSHVSYTQVSEYLRCPYRYYLSRVMKLPGEVSTAMVYGRVLHEAVAEFASSLVSESDSVITEEQYAAAEKRALAMFADSWSDNQDDALFSSTDHERELYEQGVLALEAFFQAHKRESPRVLHVEHPFSVFVPEADVELRGVWDRIDEVDSPSHDTCHRVIKEFKSNMSGAARDMGKQARDSLQLKMYMYAFERVFGSLAFGAALQIIGGDDKSNAAGFITSSASSAQEAVESIVEAVSGMRAGQFAPRPGFMECAFCPYASSACRAAGNVGT